MQTETTLTDNLFTKKERFFPPTSELILKRVSLEETLALLNIGDPFAANYRCILKDSISLENVSIVGIF